MQIIPVFRPTYHTFTRFFKRKVPTLHFEKRGIVYRIFKSSK